MAKLQISLYASIAKDPEQPHRNEDAWLADVAGQRWALSDGASESYDSRAWAQALVQKYIADPGVSTAWVAAAVAEYTRSIDYSALSWSRQAAFDRGSFATLLGVELGPNGTDFEILAIGDSLAVHVRAGALLASYPYRTADEFDLRPNLLSTLAQANQFVGEPDFFTGNSDRTWTVVPGDIVYLVTDAVGQWILKELASTDVPSSLSALESLQTEADFEALVLQLRQERRMRLDDSTLVRLVVEPS
ncbi:hypothetical protein [Roseateles cavernae]|uniref:hypothetical protein n=1 Tax=Roseateles cavernae TaxID=3153578 RepID=UPI0032E503C7